MQKQLIILVILIFGFTNIKSQNVNNYYPKGSRLVSAFPYGYGVTYGNQSGNEKFGFSFGHILRYGYFIGDKSLISLGTIQNYHYYTAPIDGKDEYSHTTTSTLMLSYRYYVLNKRFTPYIDVGFENFFNYDDWEAWDGLDPKIYYVGSAYAGIGVSIPLGSVKFDLAYRYLHPTFYYKDSELYNRFGFSSGWFFSPSVTIIFKPKNN